MPKEIHKVIITGVGGSGVVWNGTLIARAGMRKYQYVTRLPNFTAAMRGGPCECMVVLSNERIRTPLISRGDVLIVLNNSQLKPFEERVLTDGLIVLESTGLGVKVEREDVKVIEIPAVEIASNVGNPLVSNMVLLGAYVRTTGVFPPEFIEKEIEAKFGMTETGVASSTQEALLDHNMGAFRRGFELMKTVG